MKFGEINEDKLLTSFFFRIQTCNLIYELQVEFNSKVIFYSWNV